MHLDAGHPGEGPTDATTPPAGEDSTPADGGGNVGAVETPIEDSTPPEAPTRLRRNTSHGFYMLGLERTKVETVVDDEDNEVSRPCCNLRPGPTDPFMVPNEDGDDESATDEGEEDVSDFCIGPIRHNPELEFEFQDEPDNNESGLQFAKYQHELASELTNEASNVMHDLDDPCDTFDRDADEQLHSRRPDFRSAGCSIS